MAKLLNVFLVLVFAFSCSNHNYYRSKSYSNNKASAQKGKVSSRMSDYVKPSEAMQAGISMDSSYDYYHDDEDEMISDSGYYNNNSGYFKVGNPYQVFGVSYIPKEYEEYEEEGIASWYGDDFHGKQTANGETYDMDSMTAAHPTLPLPSLVEVTNLSNDKKVIVRVNDRGPFAKSRIIDVSEKAAQALDFRDVGTAKVRVKLLRNETDELLKKLKERD